MQDVKWVTHQLKWQEAVNGCHAETWSQKPQRKGPFSPRHPRKIQILSPFFHISIIPKFIHKCFPARKLFHTSLIHLDKPTRPEPLGLTAGDRWTLLGRVRISRFVGHFKIVLISPGSWCITLFIATFHGWDVRWADGISTSGAQRFGKEVPVAWTSWLVHVLESIGFRAELLATLRTADGLEPPTGSFSLGHDDRSSEKHLDCA